MAEPPSLVERFLLSDTTMYAGPGESTREYVDKMLLAALQEAQTVGRAYDNKAQIEHMREAHKLADDHEDVATASLLEVFIDDAEKRCWFLFEASREAERSGH